MTPKGIVFPLQLWGEAICATRELLARSLERRRWEGGWLSLVHGLKWRFFKSYGYSTSSKISKSLDNNDLVLEAMVLGLPPFLEASKYDLNIMVVSIQQNGWRSLLDFQNYRLRFTTIFKRYGFSLFLFPTRPIDWLLVIFPLVLWMAYSNYCCLLMIHWCYPVLINPLIVGYMSIG